MAFALDSSQWDVIRTALQKSSVAPSNSDPPRPKSSTNPKSPNSEDEAEDMLEEGGGGKPRLLTASTLKVKGNDKGKEKEKLDGPLEVLRAVEAGNEKAGYWVRTKFGKTVRVRSAFVLLPV